MTADGEAAWRRAGRGLRPKVICIGDALYRGPERSIRVDGEYFESAARVFGREEIVAAAIDADVSRSALGRLDI